MNEKVRVRIAPSPTGKLHLGTARAALFNYLFAKRNQGTFILRIEDTDKERSKPEFERDIEEGLLWLGIKWDEGPDSKQIAYSYRQSERADIYNEAIENLLSNEKAYKCFCTPEILENERNEAEKARKPYVYSGRCRNLSTQEIKTKLDFGEKYVVRFKTETGSIEFDDLIRGNIKVDASTIGDFVIVKTDGTPLFLLASVVDDVKMGITHVIRGEDHISNTPKQLMILNALGFKAPIYGHLPLVVNPDHSKLSKRKNPTSITEDFKNNGFLPDAMINFLSFLGWNPGDDREFFTLTDLEKEWNIENVGRSPAVFDMKKLEYLNGYYIRKLNLGELAELAEPFIKISDPELLNKINADKEYFLKVLALNQERLKRLSEVPELIKCFFAERLEIDKEIILQKKLPEEKSQDIFKEILEYAQSDTSKGRDDWEAYLRSLSQKFAVSDGALLWAVRYGITGEIASPGAFEVLSTLPKEQLVKRLENILGLFD